MASCLAGYVYVDANNNGNKDLGEPPIAGVIVTLTGTNDLGQPITEMATTDSNGAYQFPGLRPGIYKLTETQPINFIDGKDTIGTPGGTTTNDMFSNINLPADFCGMNNDFGELGLTPSYASKRTLLTPAQPVALTAVYPAGTTVGTTTTSTSVVLPASQPATPAVTTAAKVTTPAVTTVAKVTTPAVSTAVKVSTPVVTTPAVTTVAKVTTPVAPAVSLASTRVLIASSAAKTAASTPAIVAKPTLR